MVIKSNLPLSFPDSKGYRKYAKISTPQFDPPKSTAFTQGIEEKYDALFPIMKIEISKMKWLALTMDLWKESHKKIDVIGITAHYINSDWELKSIVLGKLFLIAILLANEQKENYNVYFQERSSSVSVIPMKILSKK